MGLLHVCINPSKSEPQSEARGKVWRSSTLSGAALTTSLRQKHVLDDQADDRWKYRLDCERGGSCNAESLGGKWMLESGDSLGNEVVWGSGEVTDKRDKRGRERARVGSHARLSFPRQTRQTGRWPEVHI